MDIDYNLVWGMYNCNVKLNGEYILCGGMPIICNSDNIFTKKNNVYLTFDLFKIEKRISQHMEYGMSLKSAISLTKKEAENSVLKLTGSIKICNFKKNYDMCPYKIEVNISGNSTNPKVEVIQLNNCNLKYKIEDSDWFGIDGYLPSHPPNPFQFYDTENGYYELSMKKIGYYIECHIKYASNNLETATKYVVDGVVNELEKIKNTRKLIE